MNFNDFFGKGMTPPAKITSSIVSLIILTFLYISQWIPEIPEKVITIGYLWLAFHIINHLFVAISEIGRKK